MKATILLYESKDADNGFSMWPLLRSTNFEVLTLNHNERALRTATEKRLGLDRPVDLLIIYVGCAGTAAFGNGMWIARQLSKLQTPLPCIVVPNKTIHVCGSTADWGLPDVYNLNQRAPKPVKRSATFELFCLSTDRVDEHLVPILNTMF